MVAVIANYFILYVILSWKFIFSNILFIQRFPLILLGGFFMLGGRLLYRLFGWHRMMMGGFKWTLRVAFFFRGIHVSLDMPKIV